MKRLVREKRKTAAFAANDYERVGKGGIIRKEGRGEIEDLAGTRRRRIKIKRENLCAQNNAKPAGYQHSPRSSGDDPSNLSRRKKQPSGQFEGEKRRRPGLSRVILGGAPMAESRVSTWEPSETMAKIVLMGGNQSQQSFAETSGAAVVGTERNRGT